MKQYLYLYYWMNPKSVTLTLYGQIVRCAFTVQIVQAQWYADIIQNLNLRRKITYSYSSRVEILKYFFLMICWFLIYIGKLSNWSRVHLSFYKMSCQNVRRVAGLLFVIRAHFFLPNFVARVRLLLLSFCFDFSHYLKRHFMM